MANTFGERIELLLKERNLSQVELANALEIKKQSINSYIKGKSRPELDVLMLFADYFECSVDYLLGRENFRSNDAMKVYDQKVEEHFNNSLKFMNVDKREYYLEAITATTASYQLLNGKSYSSEHFELTLGIFERITEITRLIARADRDTSEGKTVKLYIGDGKFATLDSRSAEYVLVLKKLLQNQLDEVCNAVKALGDIGVMVLEKNFPQVGIVLNSSKDGAKQVAKDFCDRFFNDTNDYEQEE